MRSAFRILKFFIRYLVDLVLSNIQVAKDILHPNPAFEKVVFQISLKDLSPYQQLLFSQLVSMTPGTLSVELEGDGTLHVHSLYGDTSDQLKERANDLAHTTRNGEDDGD